MFRYHLFLKYVFLLVVVLALFAGTSRAAAQEEGRGKGILGGHFLMVFPQGDFKKNVDDLGFGLNLDLGYAFPVIPVVVGLQGGFAVYGSKSFEVPLSQIIQVVTVEVNSSNNIFLGHLFVRLQPNTGFFRPYGEGLIGLGVYTTTSSVKNLNTDEEIAGSTNKSDVAFNYGVGGGIAVRISERTEEDIDESGPIEVLVDARVRMLFGGEATYFTRDAVQYIDGAVVFDSSKEYTSTTDVWTVQLGVTVIF